MPQTDDEQQILQLFEDGDRALIAADVSALQRIYADDYIQYDESGRPSTKQDVLHKLKTGAIRYVSMTSTGRRIRLLRDDVAIVHGSEDDEVEQGGKRFPVRYVYMDVVMKRDGKWQIVGSQLARPADALTDG
ncbi:MAG: nuclear transport factor 2 family protein [Acidobacteriia bacterium]|nr:nuclear transport factor 2 family protein [Terriglobia bacterium]